MSGRKLKPNEKRAWAGVAKSVRARADADIPDMAEDLAAFEKTLSASRRRPKTDPRPEQAAGPLRHPLAIFATGSRTRLEPPKTATGLPHNRGRERKVRRGQIGITGTLDLHGHTQATAEAAFMGFLRQHQSARSQCVLVITGKGKRGEGVLRQRFLQWLERDTVRALVSSFAGAHQKHGGSGAFYVFLRKRP